MTLSKDEQLVRALPTLKKHWALLSADIQRLLSYSQDQALISFDVTAELASAGLEGGACERAPRNRGRAASVLPIADLTFGGLSAWVGFREVWLKGRGNTYVFSHSGMTVHLGQRGSVEKFQAFRAEWPGPVGYDQGAPQFSSPGAGHPHWQVDLLETVVSTEFQRTHDEAAALRASLLDEEHEQQFEPEAAPTMSEIIRAYPIDRFHFASVAPWWERNAMHANVPPDEAGVRRWVLQSLAYIQSELRKT